MNLLELRAIRMAMKAFLPTIKGRLVQVLTDYTTAMWYSSRQSGVGLWALCQEVLRLWKWLDHQGIFLVVHHLADL